MQDEFVVIKESSATRFKKMLQEFKNKGYKIKTTAILTEIVRINGCVEPQIVFTAVAELEPEHFIL